MSRNVCEYVKNNKLFMVLMIIVVVQMSLTFYYGLLKHCNYLDSFNDLGHYDNSIWMAMQRELSVRTINFNQSSVDHIEPILLFLIPFYLLVPSVVWLIAVQSIVIPLTGLPLYFLARRVGQSDQAAFFWSLSCLLSPFVLSAASWDFHPVFIAAPFISLSYLALEKKQPTLLFAACLLVLICKEHFGLLVIGFGLLWYLRYREWKYGLLLVVLGAGYFCLVMFILIPVVSETGQHAMIVTGDGSVSRYGWLGGSVNEIFGAILNRPFEVARLAMFSPGGITYLTCLFLPLLFLPLIGLEFMLPGLADLAANLLSASPMPRSVHAYHSVTLMPVIIVSGIYGSCRLAKCVKFAKTERQSFVVLATTMVFSYIFFPFVTFPGGYGLWEPKRMLPYSDNNYAEVKVFIDNFPSLSVQSNIGAHFTQRNDVYIYPKNVGEVDAIVLYLDSPTFASRGETPREIATLAYHLQMDTQEYFTSIKKLIDDNTYEGIVWKEPWLVFYKCEGPVTERSVISKEISEIEKSVMGKKL